MEVDDTDVAATTRTARSGPTAPPRPRAAVGTGSVGLGLWRTVTWPVNFVLSVVLGSWYFLSECHSRLGCADHRSTDIHAAISITILASPASSALSFYSVIY
jgi:hypothetical protein